jgi:hypothetical protein
MALTAPEVKGTPVVDMTTILARETIRQAAGESRLLSQRR